MLPNSFFARYIDQDKYKPFDRQPFVKHNNFMTESIIQYNMELRHFRCIRILGKNKIKVIDYDTIEYFEN